MSLPALKLYEYPPLFDRIYEQIAEGEGEITPELLAELEQLEAGRGEKLQACRDAYFSHKATAAAIEAEIARLREQAATHVRTMTWLKEYVRATLEAMQVEKYPLHRGSLRMQQNSRPAIRWDGPPDTIPDDYQRVRIELDGTAAYEAWKRDELPSRFVVERGSHVRLS